MRDAARADPPGRRSAGGADYGPTVIKRAPVAAGALAEFILARAGQTILAGYGFEPAAR